MDWKIRLMENQMSRITKETKSTGMTRGDRRGIWGGRLLLKRGYGKRNDMKDKFLARQRRKDMNCGRHEIWMLVWTVETSNMNSPNVLIWQIFNRTFWTPSWLEKIKVDPVKQTEANLSGGWNNGEIKDVKKLNGRKNSVLRREKMKRPEEKTGRGKSSMWVARHRMRSSVPVSEMSWT